MSQFFLSTTMSTAMSGVSFTSTLFHIISLPITAFLMAEYGWSAKDALQFIREKRPMANPNPGLLVWQYTHPVFFLVKATHESLEVYHKHFPLFCNYDPHRLIIWLFYAIFCYSGHTIITNSHTV